MTKPNKNQDKHWPPDNVRDITQKSERRQLADTKPGKFNTLQVALLKR